MKINTGITGFSQEHRKSIFIGFSEKSCDCCVFSIIPQEMEVFHEN